MKKVKIRINKETKPVTYLCNKIEPEAELEAIGVNTQYELLRYFNIDNKEGYYIVGLLLYYNNGGHECIIYSPLRTSNFRYNIKGTDITFNN